MSVVRGFVRALPSVNSFGGCERAFFNFAAVGGLNGTRVHGIEFGECRDLRGGHFDGSLHYQPPHTFAAGRGREGAVEIVIVLIGREQIAGVDGDGRHFIFFVFFFGQIVPDLLDCGVFCAGLHEQCDDGGATRAFVDYMNHHRVFFSGNLFFARPVEVKLCERVGGAVDGDAAAGGEIDANRVAIVDDLQGRGFVVNLNRGERGVLLRTLDIDRGLALAGLAGGETGSRSAQCAGPSGPEYPQCGA